MSKQTDLINIPDAITVSGSNVGIGTSNPDTRLHAYTTGYPVAKFERYGSSTATRGSTQLGHSSLGYSGGTGADTYIVAEHGFGVAVNAGTHALVITDGGNVGTGTTNPNNYSANHKSITLNAPTTPLIDLEVNGTRTGSFVGTSTNVDINAVANVPLRFLTNDSERMRLDSSGNLLVGKTSSSTTTAGNELRAGGLAAFTRSGSYSLNLNRLSSDGDIAVFQKDNTTVGSIGTSGGDLIISGRTSSAKSGIRFDNNTITPALNGADVDASVDLGYSSRRFKDAYLSGGVYLGGTGSANKLEDYEEGTWTASFGGTNASNIGNTTGYYTKIGNTVHFTYYSSEVDLANAVTGGARIYGLPFTSSNSTQRYGLFLTSYGNAIQNESNGGFVAKNGNYMLFMIQESNSETTWYNGTNKRIMVAGTYMTS